MSKWLTYEDILGRYGRVKRWVQVRVDRADIRRRYVTSGGRRRAMFHAGDVAREDAESRKLEVVDGRMKTVRNGRTSEPPTPAVYKPAVGDPVDVYPAPAPGRPLREDHRRRAKVVAVYKDKRFALVEFPAGYRECCFLDQMQVVRGAMRRAG